jgi:hypothetical protein
LANASATFSLRLADELAKGKKESREMTKLQFGARTTLNPAALGNRRDARAFAGDAIRSPEYKLIDLARDVGWLEQIRVAANECRAEAFEMLTGLADRFFAGEPVVFDNAGHFKRLRGRAYPDFASVRRDPLFDELAEANVVQLVWARRFDQVRRLRAANNYLEDVPFDDSPRRVFDVTAQEVDEAISMWDRAKALGGAAEENITRVAAGWAPEPVRLKAVAWAYGR